MSHFNSYIIHHWKEERCTFYCVKIMELTGFVMSKVTFSHIRFPGNSEIVTNDYSLMTITFTLI